MDPYSQQPTKGYQPQQNGQYPAQSLPSGQNTAGENSNYTQSTPQIIHPQTGVQPVVSSTQPTQPSSSSVLPVQTAATSSVLPDQQAAATSALPGQQAYQSQSYYPQNQQQTQNDQYGQAGGYGTYSPYSAGQYQTTQYQAAQYPSSQYTSQYQSQYPNQYPSAGYPSKTSRYPFPVKKSLFFGIVGLTVLVGGIFGITKLSSQSPSELFLSALENQMKVKSMHVVLSMATPKLNATTKVNYYVDLSNPSAPKSAGTVENSSAFLRTKIEVAAEFNANYKDVYAKFTNPAYENWILTTESDKQQLSSSKASYLSLVRDLALGANSVQGVILSGSFPKDVRSSTVKSYKSRAAYSIVSNELVNDKGTAIRKYSVKLDRDAINEIQKSVAEKFGAEFEPVSEVEKTFTFFVDTKRKLITKIEQTSTDNNIYTLTFSEHNKPFDSNPPESSVAAEVYLAGLK